MARYSNFVHSEKKKNNKKKICRRNSIVEQSRLYRGLTDAHPDTYSVADQTIPN